MSNRPAKKKIQLNDKANNFIILQKKRIIEKNNKIMRIEKKKEINILPRTRRWHEIET